MPADTAAAFISHGNSKSILAYLRCNGANLENPMIKNDKRIGYVKNSIAYPILFFSALCYDMSKENSKRQ